MATLVYTDADGIERSFTVGAEPVLVGRSPECGIRSNDPRVSRNHARFYVDHFGTLYIEDLGSANGVYVGPHRLQGGGVAPVADLVVVGSLMFQALQPDGVMPIPVGLHGTLAQWLDLERKARIAAEEERNAYGARMAELHQEMRGLQEAYALLQQQDMTMRQELEQARRNDGNAPAARGAENRVAEFKQRIDELLAERASFKQQLGAANEQLAAANEQLAAVKAQLAAQHAPRPATTAEFRVSELADELEGATVRLADAEEQAKASDAMRISTEEELAVARADLLASEERMMSELAAAEARAAAELQSRVEELEVSRADLGKAEERILDLSRKVSELEQKLSELRGVF